MFMINMKKRSITEIELDLDKAKAKLLDVQTRGHDAISKYDLSMGYDAKFYLERCPLLANHVRYHEKELTEATKHGVQQSLF